MNKKYESCLSQLFNYLKFLPGTLFVNKTIDTVRSVHQKTICILPRLLLDFWARYIS